MEPIFKRGDFFKAFMGDFGASILEGVGSLAEIIYGIYDNERRYQNEIEQQKLSNQFAREQFDETKRVNAYNEWLSQNGVQVRANDLASAGLSKVLASGSSPSYISAAAGGSMSVHNFGQGYKALALLQALQMRKNFQKQDAEISLIKAQEKNVEQTNESIKLDNVNKEIKNDYDKYYSDYWQDKQSTPDSNQWIKLLTEGLGQKDLPEKSVDSITNFIDSTFHSFKQFGSWLKSRMVDNRLIDYIKNGAQITQKQAIKLINKIKSSNDSYLEKLDTAALKLYMAPEG